MTGPQRLESWLREARALELSKEASKNRRATSNMLSFSAAEAIEAGVTREELDNFLADLYLVYCRLAIASRSFGIFYAWYDDMAGQLRSSFIEEKSEEALPFGCELAIVPKPTDVSRLVLEGQGAYGIPFSELSRDAPRDVEPPQPPLVVFARQTIAELPPAS